MFHSKKLMAIVSLVLMVALVAGCGAGGGKTEEKPKEPDVIKVGLIGPMTGGIATFGQSTKNAMQMLVDEVNAKGGILGKQVQLVVEDEENDPAKGVNAALKLINQDKVVAIVGSVASKVSLAIAPVAQQNGVPQISPTSTNDKLGAVGDYISRACFKDSFQGYVMAKFGIENLQKKTAAVLFDIGNDYSKGLAESFKASWEKMGGTVVGYESYNTNDTEFKAQLTKFKDKNPDVLFLPDYYNTVSLIARQTRELGMKAIILGGDGFDSEDLVKLGGDAVEGVYFSNHYSPEAKNPIAEQFIANYQKKYGAVPDALAALAYDAGMILFKAIEKAGKLDRAAIKDAINATKDLQAVSGSITLDQNGDPIKSAVVITIEKGKQKFVTSVNP